jgi:hypothetical protein
MPVGECCVRNYIVAVYSKIHTEHLYALCEKSAELLVLNLAVHVLTTTL